MSKSIYETLKERFGRDPSAVEISIAIADADDHESEKDRAEFEAFKANRAADILAKLEAAEKAALIADSAQPEAAHVVTRSRGVHHGLD